MRAHHYLTLFTVDGADFSHEIPEMIASVEPVNAGFCIKDPNDSRFQYVKGLRHRFGAFLHNASVALRQQGEENTVDAVDMLVCDAVFTME